MNIFLWSLNSEHNWKPFFSFCMFKFNIICYFNYLLSFNYNTCWTSPQVVDMWSLLLRTWLMQTKSWKNKGLKKSKHWKHNIYSSNLISQQKLLWYIIEQNYINMSKTIIHLLITVVKLKCIKTTTVVQSEIVVNILESKKC